MQMRPKLVLRSKHVKTAAALSMVLIFRIGLGQVGPGEANRPLPEVTGLMREVEVRQRMAEAVEKDYIFRQVSVGTENDGHGNPKKTETREYEVFWSEGVNVRQLLKRDGKELTLEEQKKEAERIDKEVAKGRERRAKGDAKGAETDSQGRQEITVSRLLELGEFTNERRETVNGRDTIVVDFAGDPKAKTHNAGEGAVHDMAGTVWVDEADKTLARADGRFVRTFKIGGGLIASVKEGTAFSFRARRINGEVWLPESFEGHGAARVALFVSFDGSVKATFGSYRKFKASSTILPGVTEVPAESAAEPEKAGSPEKPGGPEKP